MWRKLRSLLIIAVVVVVRGKGKRGEEENKASAVLCFPPYPPSFHRCVLFFFASREDRILVARKAQV